MTPNAPPLADLDAPAELKALRQWLVWRYEPAYDKDGNRLPKDLKKPYYANGSARYGAQGTDLDRRKLVSFDQAKAAAIKGGFTGIGIAMLKGTPITALDFDNCIQDGAIDPSVTAATQGTYTEYSPSGNGIRAFVLGELGSRKDCRDAAEGIGFEMFNTSGFVTFTGNITLETEVDGPGIAQPNPALHALIKERFGRVERDAYAYGDETQPEGLSEEQLESMLAKVNPDIGYHAWLDVGFALHHETQGDGFHLWDDWSAAGIKYRGPEELAGKWKGFGQNSGHPKTINSLRKLIGESGEVDLSPDDFDAIPDEPGAPRGRFPITTTREALTRIREHRWLIEDYLPQARLGVMFGATGSGKSFAALDMACAIARGIEWNGHYVEKRRVLYVVAEGQEDFLDRLKAYCLFHGLDDMDVDLMVDETPNIADRAQVSDMVKAMLAHGSYALVILDTFAQITAGLDENSAEGMGLALAQCKRISRLSGAMVLLVHHTGKDTNKGARGSSVMPAAADVMFEVCCDDDFHSVSVAKQKGGPKGAEYAFKLNLVTIGVSARGTDIKSCTVQFLDAGAGKKPALGGNEQVLLDVLHDLAGFEGAGIAEKALITQAMERAGKTGRNDKRNFERSLESLIRKNYAFKEGGLVNLAGNDDA